MRERAIPSNTMLTTESKVTFGLVRWINPKISDGTTITRNLLFVLRKTDMMNPRFMTSSAMPTATNTSAQAKSERENGELTPSTTTLPVASSSRKMALHAAKPSAIPTTPSFLNRARKSRRPRSSQRYLMILHAAKGTASMMPSVKNCRATGNTDALIQSTSASYDATSRLAASRIMRKASMSRAENA